MILELLGQFHKLINFFHTGMLFYIDNLGRFVPLNPRGSPFMPNAVPRFSVLDITPEMVRQDKEKYDQRMRHLGVEPKVEMWRDIQEFYALGVITQQGT